MLYPTIAIIGAGNMGTSLLGGLISMGYPARQLWISDPAREKLTALQESFSVHTTTDNREAAAHAEVLILAVKPSLVAAVAHDLRHHLQAHPVLVISIAAGVRITNIAEWLTIEGSPQAISIVRAMPNIPAVLGVGATALYANPTVSQKHRELAESIVRAVGIAVWVNDEALMDTVTALSGSGPAYFFLIMECLQKAAEELGLNQEQARLLTMQTALGAARMAIESDQPLSELRRQVTSPGGTTEKAISVLQENRIDLLFKKALQAAKLRSEELALLLGEPHP